MTLHKLNADAAPMALPPLDIGVTLNHREYRFVDTIVRARAARAISGAPTRYPVHRLIRCAVRSKLEPLFDDIAEGRPRRAPARTTRSSSKMPTTC